MEILEELDNNSLNELRQTFSQDHDFNLIADLLRRQHCYRINVYPSDFDEILINSSNEPKVLPLNEYPSLKRVIDNTKTDEEFFNSTHGNRGLDGQTVHTYYKQFLEHEIKPPMFFLVRRTDFPGMNEDGSFYVRDGMHHLVAYGLATNLNENAFPILGYLCTD